MLVEDVNKLSRKEWSHYVKQSYDLVRAKLPILMIGAVPRTAWLHDAGVELDPKGFVTPSRDYSASVAGLFAVGDVRAGSVKRVASAVGEGSVVVSAVHSYLQRLG